MTSRAVLETKLKTELQNCFLLEEKDKKYWLFNLAFMPASQLEAVLKVVREKNRKAEKYLLTALEHYPGKNYLTTLKQKLATAKKQAFEIDQKYQGTKAEELLEEELNNM